MLSDILLLTKVMAKIFSINEVWDSKIIFSNFSNLSHFCFHFNFRESEREREKGRRKE